MASIPTSGLAAVPKALTWLRIALGPGVILLALLWPHPEAFAACLIAAFLSDVFDGILARRLGVATADLRRLDSIADTIFYICALLVIWLLHPTAILKNSGLILILLGLEIARYVFDFWKFKREASYHMWSSKVWGVALFLGFLSVLVFQDEGAFVTGAIVIGILADLEGFLISMTLTSWHHDVPSIVHALRIRARGNAA
jgi:phosphatidylglycerophosphate synthase